jgi:preprotein translocase subunit YajC
MLASIKRGDQVVTAGGFFGIVRETKDDSYILEIADGVKARILKSSVQYRKSEEAGKKEETPAVEGLPEA